MVKGKKQKEPTKKDCIDTEVKKLMAMRVLERVAMERATEICDKTFQGEKISSKAKNFEHEELSKKEEKKYQGKVKQFEKGRKLTSCEKIKSKKFEKEGYSGDYALLKAKEECNPKPKQPPTLSLSPVIKTKLEFQQKQESTPSKKRKPSSAQPESTFSEKEEKSERKGFRKEKSPEEIKLDLELKKESRLSEIRIKEKREEMNRQAELQQQSTRQAELKLKQEEMQQKAKQQQEEMQQKAKLKQEERKQEEERKRQARKEDEERKSAEQVKRLRQSQKPAAKPRAKPAATNRKKSCPY